MKKSHVERKSNSREIEASLIINSDAPQRILNSLAHLKSVGPFQLKAEQPLSIRDQYFDTPERTLQRQGYAVRLRRVGKAQYITLKGPATVLPGGVVERLEIEQRWSEPAFRAVLDELAARGLTVGRSRTRTAPADPQANMHRLGFVLIQERFNRRLVRNVVESAGATDRALAEIVLDRVDYRFADFRVRHFEVEIEAKQAETEKIVAELLKNLRNRFKDDLRLWNYSKLETGTAIQHLLEHKTLQRVLRGKTQLTTSAYDLIDAYLSSAGGALTAGDESPGGPLLNIE